MSLDELKGVAKDSLKAVTPDVLKLNMNVNNSNNYEQQMCAIKKCISAIVSQCNPFSALNTIPQLINEIDQIIKNQIPETFDIYVSFDNQIIKNGKKIFVYTKDEMAVLIPSNIDITKISYALVDRNPYFRHSHIPCDIKNCHKGDELLKLYDMFGKFKNVKFVDNELCDFVVKFVHLGL